MCQRVYSWITPAWAAVRVSSCTWPVYHLGLSGRFWQFWLCRCTWWKNWFDNVMILKTPVVANLIFLGFLFILKCGLTSIADESGNWSSKTINMILAMNLILTPTTYWATVLADSASGVPASGQPMQTARKSKAAEKLRKKLQCRIFRESETNLTKRNRAANKTACVTVFKFTCYLQCLRTIPGAQICFVRASCSEG